MTSDRRLVALALVASLALTVAGALMSLRVELTFDEAYYTLWSRSLAWGYYDHPPMVAAWIRASTTLFGGAELGVRALNLLVFAALPGLVAFMAWRLFASAPIAALAALLWAATPIVAGAPIVTPDAPLVAFWALATAALVEVWRGAALGWLALGAALGLALLSKFTALFLGAGVGLALIVVPSLRIWWARPWPYAAAALALAIFAPFLAWNAAHGWATFFKQFGRVSAQRFAPAYLGEFLGAQLALGNPLTWIATAAGAARGFSRMTDRDAEARRLLIATLAPALLYFALHALHDRVQGNWTAPLYPALVILAAEAGCRGPAFARAAARWAPALGLPLIGLAYLHAATAWPDFGPADPLARIGGWRPLTAEVEALAQRQGAAFVLARGYASTSLLTFYGPALPPVIQREDRARWAFAPPPDPALFACPGLAFAEADAHYEATLAAHFRTVEPLGHLTRKFGAAPVDDYVIYRVADPLDGVLAPE